MPKHTEEATGELLDASGHLHDAPWYEYVPIEAATWACTFVGIAFLFTGDYAKAVAFSSASTLARGLLRRLERIEEALASGR